MLIYNHAISAMECLAMIGGSKSFSQSAVHAKIPEITASPNTRQFFPPLALGSSVMWFGTTIFTVTNLPYKGSAHSMRWTPPVTLGPVYVPQVDIWDQSVEFPTLTSTPCSHLPIYNVTEYSIYHDLYFDFIYIQLCKIFLLLSLGEVLQNKINNELDEMAKTSNIYQYQYVTKNYKRNKCGNSDPRKKWTWDVMRQGICNSEARNFPNIPILYNIYCSC
jgi:hypothetical protein